MTNLTNKLFLPVFMLLLSISPAAAHNDTFFNSPHELELKPASFSEPAYQLAKSYWLGGADINLGFKGDDDDTICQARGYTTAPCTANKTPIKYCGSNNKYHLCGCDTSIYKYSSSLCPDGTSPNGDTCDGLSSGCDCSGYGSGYIWQDDQCIFSCSSSDDCFNGQVCDIEEGKCYDCLKTDDCKENEICVQNRCEARDLCAGVNCTGGRSCNSETGACECPSGEVFYNNRCEAPSCTNKEIQCSGSTPVCAANGKCVECVSASDCGSDKECVNNTCQIIDVCKNVTCTGRKECVDGTCVCPSGLKDYGSGVCEEADCTNGGVICTGGKTCQNNICKCPSDKPYESGNGCVVCTQDSHCNTGAGEKCISNSCQTVDRCANVNCGSGGKICNADTGGCECPSNKPYESNGVCETANCENGGVICTGGKTCQNNICKCPGDKPYESGSSCVECTQASHCENGKTCQNNICKCPSNKPYESGSSCVECTQDSHCNTANHETCDLTLKTCKKCTPTCRNETSCLYGEETKSDGCGGTCTVCKVCELNSIACKVGDVLYSDKKCYATKPACREGIGVVFDTNERLAVGLTEYMTFWGPVIMPPEGVDILDLRNLTDIPAANREEELETFEADGKSNTKIILRHGIMNGIIYGAAQYTQDSAPQGTNKDYDWWLPSAAEIKSLASNYETVNKTLVAVGTPLSYRKEYWLSIEFDPAYAMAYILGFYFTAIPKNIENVAYSRPITSY